MELDQQQEEHKLKMRLLDPEDAKEREHQRRMQELAVTTRCQQDLMVTTSKCNRYQVVTSQFASSSSSERDRGDDTDNNFIDI